MFKSSRIPAVALVALSSLSAMALGFTCPLKKPGRRPPQSGPAPTGSSELRVRGLATALGSREEASSEASSVASGHGHPCEQNVTVTFPALAALDDLPRGARLASPPLQVRDHAFRVLLYPRGGGRCSSDAGAKRSGDGPSRKEDAARDRVGVYLQYLPRGAEETVDATFGLRLKGRQSSGPRFDVETTSGTRFVAEGRGDPGAGTATDCGAHVMQSFLLNDFLGGDGSAAPLDVEVRVKLHPRVAEAPAGAEGAPGPLSFADIRETADADRHDAGRVRVGRTVVPVLRGLAQRPRLMELGAYPGVEYRLARILDPDTGEELFASVPGADYELAPVYPLVPRLERPWPVRVNERELPKLLTMNKYNALYAAGALATAATGLAAAFVLSQLISLFLIPSKSMDPTLLVGDVLVVEKVTPRILRNPQVGDVVLFHPNRQLQDIVTASGGRISDRDLFVKRVAAGPGDTVSVDATGGVAVNGAPAAGRRDLCAEEPLRLIRRYVTPVADRALRDDELFVLGDCGSVSVDSRAWGPLNKEDLVGRPLLRVWPPARVGAVAGLPSDAPGR